MNKENFLELDCCSQNYLQKTISPIEIINSTHGSSNDSSFYHNITEAITNSQYKSLPAEFSNFQKSTINRTPTKMRGENGIYSKGISKRSNLNQENVKPYAQISNAGKRMKIINFENSAPNNIMELDKFYSNKSNNSSTTPTKVNIKPQNSIKTFNIPISKQKKKIMSSEQIELIRINKEKENLRLIKLKNAQTMDKKKIYFNLPVSPLTSNINNDNIFKDINNCELLKKKRNEKEALISSSEFTNKINKEKAFNSKKMLGKMKNCRSKSPVNYDEDLKEIKSKFENISIYNKTPNNKTPVKNYNRDNIPSPVRFKLPSSYIRNHFKPNTSADVSTKTTPVKNSAFHTNTTDFSNNSFTSKFENIISCTRKEKENIDKLEKEKKKREVKLNTKKNYYYKDRVIN